MSGVLLADPKQFASKQFDDEQKPSAMFDVE
jgi:hypothetical protein